MRGRASPHCSTLSWRHRMYSNYKHCTCSAVFRYGQIWYSFLYYHSKTTALNRHYTEGTESRDTQKESADNEAWTLVFAVLHASFFAWSDLPNIRISLFVLQLLLAQNPFLSSVIISLFLKGALSPSQSFLGSGKGTGLRPGYSRHSFSLVSAIHAGKGTGLISETYIGIIGNEKSSFLGNKHGRKWAWSCFWSFWEFWSLLEN